MGTFPPYRHDETLFMDWRFVDDERWRDIYVALNGAGVESMQAKWDEMFGNKDEGEGMKDEEYKKEVEVSEEVKIKKPRKNSVAKKPTAKKSTAKKDYS